MEITPASWTVLSRLFDEAVEMEPDTRESWLADLPAEFAGLRDPLRSLLAAHAGAETADFLKSMPPLDITAGAAVGTVVGPYAIQEELGRGGMGIVWRAVRLDGHVKRPVALKLPNPSLARSLLERFARERDILAGLTHRNIARLYDAGVTAEGQPYLALELVQGDPIDVYCDAHGLDLKRRLVLFEQALAGIQFAHSRLVVHRDIKPSNLLVTPEGEVKLLDFGIAKLLVEGAVSDSELTQLGGPALTPAYASPEQLLGQPIGAASDVYSLGVLLYQLLVGSSPYKPARETRASLEEAIVSVDPLRPSKVVIDATQAAARASTPQKLARQLAGDLDTIVLKCLKKPVTERYQSVQALHDDLARYLAGRPVRARPDSAWYRTGKFIGRHPAGTAAAAIAILALGGFTLSLGVQLGHVTRERDRADRLARFMVSVFEVSDPTVAAESRITARDLLDKAALDIESGVGLDPIQRAQLVVPMARSYTNLGAFDRSEQLLRRELARAAQALGPAHPQTMALELELLWKFYGARQFTTALPFGEALLARQRRVLGPENPLTARTESYLMHVLFAMGRSQEAAKIGRHELRVLRRTAPPGDLDLLGDEADVAFFQFRAGEGPPQEAERLLRELVERSKSLRGPANARTLSAIDRLGVVLAGEHRFDDEVALLRSAIADGERVLGSEPFVMSDLLDNLGAALVHQGDLSGAETVLRKSLQMNRHLHGDTSPRVGPAEYNLACVLARRGMTDEALGLLEAAVQHDLVRDAALQMAADEDLVSLQKEPRFVALVRKVSEFK